MSRGMLSLYPTGFPSPNRPYSCLEKTFLVLTVVGTLLVIVVPTVYHFSFDGALNGYKQADVTVPCFTTQNYTFAYGLPGADGADFDRNSLKRLQDWLPPATTVTMMSMDVVVDRIVYFVVSKTSIVVNHTMVFEPTKCFGHSLYFEYRVVPTIKENVHFNFTVVPIGARLAGCNEPLWIILFCVCSLLLPISAFTFTALRCRPRKDGYDEAIAEEWGLIDPKDLTTDLGNYGSFLLGYILGPVAGTLCLCFSFGRKRLYKFGVCMSFVFVFLGFAIGFPAREVHNWENMATLWMSWYAGVGVAVIVAAIYWFIYVKPIIIEQGENEVADTPLGDWKEGLCGVPLGLFFIIFGFIFAVFRFSPTGRVGALIGMSLTASAFVFTCYALIWTRSSLAHPVCAPNWEIDPGLAPIYAPFFTIGVWGFLYYYLMFARKRPSEDADGQLYCR